MLPFAAMGWPRQPNKLERSHSLAECAASRKRVGGFHALEGSNPSPLRSSDPGHMLSGNLLQSEDPGRQPSASTRGWNCRGSSAGGRIDGADSNSTRLPIQYGIRPRPQFGPSLPGYAAQQAAGVAALLALGLFARPTPHSLGRSLCRRGGIWVSSASLSLVDIWPVLAVALPFASGIDLGPFSLADGLLAALPWPSGSSTAYDATGCVST